MSSRSAKSSLDPYGIYGTRTENRLRASQRRRKTQKFLLGAGFLGVLVVLLAYSRLRNDDLYYAHTSHETGVQPNALPIYASWLSSGESALLLAGRDGQLLRYELSPENSTKRVLWRSDFPLHTPQIYQDKAFIPCEDGVLTALSWRSGKLLWRVRFDSALIAQPVAYQVTVGGQLRPVVVAAADSGLVMAIDIGNGRLLWRVRLPAPIGNGLSAVESNGRARVMVPLLGGSAMRGGTWCLDGANGQVKWRFPSDGREEAVQFAAPVPDLAANRVFLANDFGVVFALNLTTGKYNPKQAQGWKTNLQQHDEADSDQDVIVRNTPLLLNHSARNDETTQSNNALVVGGSDGIVRYLSIKDGIERWQFATQQPILSLSQVILPEVGEFVMVLNHSSTLFLVDARTGRLGWRFASNDGNFAGAIVQGQILYAITESGSIQQFDLSQLTTPSRS